MNSQNKTLSIILALVFVLQAQCLLFAFLIWKIVIVVSWPAEYLALALALLLCVPACYILYQLAVNAGILAGRNANPGGIPGYPPAGSGPAAFQNMETVADPNYQSAPNRVNLAKTSDASSAAGAAGEMEFVSAAQDDKTQATVFSPAGPVGEETEFVKPEKAAEAVAAEPDEPGELPAETPAEEADAKRQEAMEAETTGQDTEEIPEETADEVEAEAGEEAKTEEEPAEVMPEEEEETTPPIEEIPEEEPARDEETAEDHTEEDHTEEVETTETDIADEESPAGQAPAPEPEDASMQEQAAPAEPAAAENTDTENLPDETEDVDGEEEKTAAPRQNLRLTLQSEEGPVHVRPGQYPFVLGRSLQAADCAIGDGSVGRRHAQIEYTQGAFLVTDLGSRNGSFVNGKPVQAPAPLAAGDTLTLGRVDIEVGIGP